MSLRALVFPLSTRRSVSIAVIATLLAAPLVLAPASFAVADDAVLADDATIAAPVDPPLVEAAPVETTPIEPTASVESPPAPVPSEVPVAPTPAGETAPDGSSPEADQAAAAAAAPSAPTSVTATGQVFAVHLSWAPPVDDGGSAVTGYEYSWKLHSQDETAWSNPLAAAPPTRFQNFSGLGLSHDFRVRAVNEIAPGLWSSVVSATPMNFVIVIPTPPAAPTNLVLTAGDAKIDAAWTAPAGTVSSYSVVVSAPGEPTLNLSSSSPGIAITGLKNSVSYEVAVRGQNMAGSGAAVSGSTTPYVFAPVFTLADGSSATGRTLHSGDRITISGSGAIPLLGVFVELHSAPIALGDTMVDVDGTYSLSFAIPANVTAGNHSLVAFLAGDTSTVAQASIAVVIPAAAIVPAAVPGGLVLTGVDPLLPISFALALMVTGGLAILTARRRRSA